MKTTLIAILAAALPCMLAPSSRAAESKMLWQIGKTDNSNAEFLFAPNGYANFKEDALFVVGQSDPKHDWPYVHPGPNDTWAGGRPHTFTIVFGASNTSAEGECRLKFALLDTQQPTPPKLHIDVNGSPFDQQMPPGAGDASVNGDPSKGKHYQFAVTFPASLLKSGNNRIGITGVTGSWMLYDSVSLETPATVAAAPVTEFLSVRSVRATPALANRGSGGHPAELMQPVTMSLVYVGAPQQASLRINGKETMLVNLTQGSCDLETFAPAVEQATEATISLVAGDKTLATSTVTLTPVRKWEVYVLMHSHTDIGYTDIQPNIEKKQAQNVIRALELIRETKDYPAGAKFKWNLEVMWTADQFARVATPQQTREFNQAVHDGNIGVDAMYGNLLTGLCRYEEMVRQIGYATSLGRRNGMKVDSMMISDVPGMTWGVVPALASHGVKYISNGPNEGDRIGYVRVQWENRPFYWQSPSGTEKVLYWGAQGGYSFGHHFATLKEGLPHLFANLEAQKYPYDIVQLRWTKGDNGPPDEGVMAAVRDWNAKYVYPKLVIATTSEAFHAFEKRYGDKLPTFRGDMTPYWEDGAGSSSRETALNRHSVDRLLQAETLWAMRNPGAFPLADFAVAWKNAAMYSEHTWGAFNSVSQPDLAFVKNQWNYKQGYALTADKVSRELLNKSLAGKPAGTTSSAVDVFNTSSWARTDLVTLPKETLGECVKDASGWIARSQRLSTGELVFLASDIPAFGAKRYVIGDGAPTGGMAAATSTSLTTPMLQVKLDAATGDITSLRRDGIETDMANGRINNYIYLPGGNVNDAKPAGPAKITIKEKGPLVVSLLVQSAAPGCKSLTREVRLIDGIDRVEIIDMVDKLPVRTVEGVHFGFSFNVAEPVVHINSPGAIGQPETDQLPGACKNWFSVERWVDISNATQGVTWATADAPLMEMGGLTANLPRGQPDPNAYLKTITPSATIYSWVMNNHWHTNYRAEQDGPTLFRYALRPHHGYDAAAATRFGVESTQALLVTPATGPAPAAGRLKLDTDQLIVSSWKPCEDGKGWMVRLYNPTAQPQTTALRWSQPVRQTCLSSAEEEQGPDAPDAVTVPKLGTVTLRVIP